MKSFLFTSVALLRVHLAEMSKFYYAVAKGRQPGVYNSWGECKTHVEGFVGAVFRKFPTEQQALEFVREKSASPIKSAAGNQFFSAESKRNMSLQEEVNSLKSTLQNLQRNIKDFMQQKESEIENLTRTVQELETRLASSGSSLTGVSRAGHVSSERSYSTSSANGSTVKRKSDASPVQNGAKQSKMDSSDACPPFRLDEEGYVQVYTDGACESNGQKGAKAGIGVWFADNHPLNASEPVRGRATNNTAEIQAATYALELANAAGIDKLSIYTDSEFLINCVTKWMNRWKKNGWKVTSGDPVKNKEDLEALEEAKQQVDVKWTHVRGHAGIYGNECADQLARAGAERYGKPSQEL